MMKQGSASAHLVPKPVSLQHLLQDLDRQLQTRPPVRLQYSRYQFRLLEAVVERHITKLEHLCVSRSGQKPPPPPGRPSFTKLHCSGGRGEASYHRGIGKKTDGNNSPGCSEEGVVDPHPEKTQAGRAH